MWKNEWQDTEEWRAENTRIINTFRKMFEERMDSLRWKAWRLRTKVWRECPEWLRDQAKYRKMFGKWIPEVNNEP